MLESGTYQGAKVELGKKNWQFIAKDGSVAVVNRMDNIVLFTKGSFEQT